MRKLYTLALILFSNFAFTQQNIKTLLKKLNNESIPYISVKELQNLNAVTLLDAREQNEYDISHIKNALHVGYTNFNIKTVTDVIKNKNSKIVVYCSLGVRSEDIAEKLKHIGYTNVYNLYGGIFEWKNSDLDIYNTQNQITNKVHTYSKKWSAWLNKGEKIYE